MDKVENMTEGIGHLLLHKSELGEKSVLWHSVRLCHDQIVSIRVEVEGIFEEIS